MKKLNLALSILGLCAFNHLRAQNLFPNKLNNCVVEQFCLDCGDEKAGVKTDEFAGLIENLNRKNNYQGVSGKILLQVLIDSLGQGCVLSHTDNSKNPVTLHIIKILNEFGGWIPAKEKGKVVGRTSINLVAEVQGGVLSIKKQSIDFDAFRKSFDHPVKPDVDNNHYKYKNQNLSSYNIKIFNENNSGLRNSLENNITIDNDNTLWLATEWGLMKFNGSEFVRAEPEGVDRKEDYVTDVIAVDNDNMKWIKHRENIYKFNGSNCTKYDTTTIGFNEVNKIVNNPNTGELFFCSDNGLHIYKGGAWTTISTRESANLPSNKISFARRDSRRRLWIGTASGSAMIDESGKLTNFNETGTVLKSKCITSLDEDEKGNVFLAVYEYNRKNKEAVNDDGVARYNAYGEITQFTTSNSGMPCNYVTKILYDKKEKILWIATDKAGLVRFDLNNGWENYHNENSKIPTSYISDMAFDKNGVLYIATRQGLVKMERKQ